MEAFILILLIMAILSGLATSAYKAFLFFYRPDMYLEEKRQKHELEMATRTRNRQALGLVGFLIRLFLGR